MPLSRDPVISRTEAIRIAVTAALVTSLIHQLAEDRRTERAAASRDAYLGGVTAAGGGGVLMDESRP